MSAKKILFVSHEATRTGAPLSLLRLMKWFKANTDISFITLLLDNQKLAGELQSEFEALSPVLFFYPQDSISKFLKKLAYKIKILPVDWSDRQHFKKLKKQIVKENIDLIYANTIVNSKTLEFLSEFLNCPTICHVRELEWIIRLVGLKKFKIVKQHTQQYIAISEAVKRNLIENHNIAEDRIEVIYNGVVLNPTNNLDNSQLTRERICQELDIPKEAAIVCASGTTDWRKGTDLFVQLAHAVNQQSPQTPVYFLWVGGMEKDIYIEQLKYDANMLGLGKYVRFLGSRANPLDYYAACDVFTLLSREEAFGMVCIEAASLGKPIICFDRAGGAQEFVENDCGFVVPYLDIETMATKIVTLLNSPQLYKSLGQRAKQKVQERHDINITASKVFKVIEKKIL